MPHSPPPLVPWLLRQIASEWESAPKRKGGGGGRYTNPQWTKSKLIPFSAKTMKRLEVAARVLTEHSGRKVYPMQVAAMLLEYSVTEVMDG